MVSRPHVPDDSLAPDYKKAMRIADQSLATNCMQRQLWMKVENLVADRDFWKKQTTSYRRITRVFSVLFAVIAVLWVYRLFDGM